MLLFPFLLSDVSVSGIRSGDGYEHQQRKVEKGKSGCQRPNAT